MKRKILILLLLCAILMTALSVSVSAVSTETRAVSESTRYGITTLSGNARYVYDMLVAGIMKDTPDATISFDPSRKVSLDELSLGYMIFASDFPECFWLGQQYSYSHVGSTVLSITPAYSFTGARLSEAKTALDQAIRSILSGLPSGSNYEKALYLHDALAGWVTYKKAGEHQTVYGALVARQAVCAGYAAAYQLLLQEAGIRAWTVTGWSSDPSSGVAVAHAWNVVWMNDSTCVYTDVTWDDQGDSLFRYYFNLSKEEIAVDHVVNTDVFTLPNCNHKSESYFDKNDFTVTDQISIGEIASLFGPAESGARSAVLYYARTTPFETWIAENVIPLYQALGGGYGTLGYSYSRMENEIHLTIQGNFPIGTTYTVSITPGNHIIAGGSTAQTVPAGTAINSMTCTAADGYYFPENYGTGLNGITVVRKNAKEITISGTPTKNTALVLPAPSATVQLSVPTAVFTATGSDSGILSGLKTSWKYSLNGGKSYTAITSTELTIPGGITEEYGIVLKAFGDGAATSDSAPQTIRLTKAKTPTSVTATACTTSANTDGTLRGLSISMEYRKAGTTVWTACTGDSISGLPAGTYHVRVKASGTALASDYLAVSIAAFKASAVTGVTLDSTLSLMTGETKGLSWTVIPQNATNPAVSFSSSDPSVASVDPSTGAVTGVSHGTAVITVRTADGNFTDTCTVTVTCSHASKTKTDEIRPTCQSSGQSAYYTCDLCGQLFDMSGSKIQTIPALGKDEKNHTSVTPFPEVTGSCLSPGHAAYEKCTACNTVTSGSDAPVYAAHNYGALVPASPELHTENELSAAVAAHYRCAVCQKYFTESKSETTLSALTGPMPSHSYGAAWQSDDAMHWKSCPCGSKSELSSHSFEWIVDTPATEEKPGVQHEECTICLKKQNENTELAPIDHTHVEIKHVPAVPATCVKDGTLEHWICSHASCSGKFYGDAECKSLLTSITISKATALHTYGEQVAEVAPVHTSTEVRDGVRAHYRCTLCNAYFDTSKIPTTEAALAIPSTHSFATEWYRDESGHAHLCICGAKEDAAEHSFGEWNILQEATETRKGLRERVCACSFRILEEYTLDAGDTTESDGASDTAEIPPQESQSGSTEQTTDTDDDALSIGCFSVLDASALLIAHLICIPALLLLKKKREDTN